MLKLPLKFSKSLLILLSISFFFTHPTISQAFSGSGAGTSVSPYQITDCDELLEIDDELDAYYALTQNIDCSSTSFSPMAASGTSFTGTLDGNDHTVSGIEITTGSGVYAAIFANSGVGATIKNIHLTEGSVTNSGITYAASFVANVQGSLTISDTSSDLNITGRSPAGLVGRVNSGDSVIVTINRSSFTGDLSSGEVYVGGLAGIVLSGEIHITDSYTSGTYTGGNYTGGLVGYIGEGTITRSYSIADITADGGNYAGGLVGYYGGSGVTNSFSAGPISGTNDDMGAVFGFAEGSFSSVYFDVYVAGISDCSGLGGGTCNAVNSSNSTPNYFKNNNTNPPLDSWNFSGVWLTSANYPILGVADEVSSENPRSDSTSSSSSAWQCPNRAPNSAPDLFQVNTNGSSATVYFTPASNSDRYYIAYGYFPGDFRFGAEFTAPYNDGVIDYTVHLLAPSSTYYFQVRGGNGCMPGDWSSVLRASTTSGIQAVFYR